MKTTYIWYSFGTQTDESVITIFGRETFEIDVEGIILFVFIENNSFE